MSHKMMGDSLLMDLPPEIATGVLRLLGEQDRANVRAVCRRCRDLVDSPSVWHGRTVTIFIHDLPQVEDSIWKTLERRKHTHMFLEYSKTGVPVRLCKRFDNNILKMFLRVCSNLKVLKGDIELLTILMDTLKKQHHALPPLTGLNCCIRQLILAFHEPVILHYPKLETLRLEFDGLNWPLVETFLILHVHHMAALQSLHIEWHFWRSMQLFDSATRTDISQLLLSLPRLKKFSFALLTKISVGPMDIDLKASDLFRKPDILRDDVSREPLQLLNVSLTFPVTSWSCIHCESAGDGFGPVGDPDVFLDRHALAQLPCLRHLHLAHLSNMTSTSSQIQQFLHNLKNSFPQLQSLDLSFYLCPHGNHTTDEDISQWLGIMPPRLTRLALEFKHLSCSAVPLYETLPLALKRNLVELDLGSYQLMPSELLRVKIDSPHLVKCSFAIQHTVRESEFLSLAEITSLRTVCLRLRGSTECHLRALGLSLWQHSDHRILFTIETR